MTRARKLSIGGIIAALLALLLSWLQPLELCCLEFPGSPKIESRERLVDAQEKVEHASESHGFFPNFRALRLLTAGRKFGPFIYGRDDRADYFTNAVRLDPKIKDNMDATVLIVDKRIVTESGDGFDLLGERLRDQEVCSCEKFSNQFATADGAPCTGFFFDDKHVVTASHCVPRTDEVGRLRFIHGFHVNGDGEPPRHFAKKDVLMALDVAYRSNPCDKLDPDFVVIRLQEPIAVTPSERAPKTPDENTDVYEIGYPIGLPAKYAPGAQVLKNDPAVAHFLANLDGFRGNSGSPVFNAQHQIVGIHVRGVLALARPCGCWTSTWCPNKACKGEEITRVGLLPKAADLCTKTDGTCDPYGTNRCEGKELNPHPPSSFEIWLANRRMRGR